MKLYDKFFLVLAHIGLPFPKYCGLDFVSTPATDGKIDIYIATPRTHKLVDVLGTDWVSGSGGRYAPPVDGLVRSYQVDKDQPIILQYHDGYQVTLPFYGERSYIAIVLNGYGSLVQAGLEGVNRVAFAQFEYPSRRLKLYYANHDELN